MQKLLDILATLLGVAVGRNDPLMLAGLDSLDTLRLRKQVEAAFGVVLPSLALYDPCSVTDLANFVGPRIVTGRVPAAGDTKKRCDWEDQVAQVRHWRALQC